MIKGKNIHKQNPLNNSFFSFKNKLSFICDVIRKILIIIEVQHIELNSKKL